MLCTLLSARVAVPAAVPALRSRCPRPAIWLWLAMAAALLVAIAPVVSRSLQAMHDSHAATTVTPGHLVPAPAMDGHAGGHHHHDPATPPPAPAAATNPHADHGAACDYCLIAARALAMVVAVLLVLLLRLPPTQAPPPRRLALASPAWPAHPARGPPPSA